jgi:hypothetical protein
MSDADQMAVLLERDRLRRIVELMKLKEMYTEPDCCDPRESGLDYWCETKEGIELEGLLAKQKGQ